jgi:hypothetical protein
VQLPAVRAVLHGGTVTDDDDDMPSPRIIDLHGQRARAYDMVRGWCDTFRDEMLKVANTMQRMVVSPEVFEKLGTLFPEVQP